MPLSDSFYPMTTYKVIANYELQKSNREKSIANHETVISNLEITFNMIGKEINIIPYKIQAHKKRCLIGQHDDNQTPESIYWL